MTWVILSQAYFIISTDFTFLEFTTLLKITIKRGAIKKTQ